MIGAKFLSLTRWLPWPPLLEDAVAYLANHSQPHLEGIMGEWEEHPTRHFYIQAIIANCRLYGIALEEKGVQEIVGKSLTVNDFHNSVTSYTEPYVYGSVRVNRHDVYQLLRNFYGDETNDDFTIYASAALLVYHRHVAAVRAYVRGCRDRIMATVKKGTHVASPQWWKHLRDWKRTFWKKERKAAETEVVDVLSMMDRPLPCRSRSDEVCDWPRCDCAWNTDDSDYPR